MKNNFDSFNKDEIEFECNGMSYNETISEVMFN